MRCPVLPTEKGEAAFIRNGWALAEPDPPSEVSWGSYYSAQGARARGGFESLPVRKSALPFLEIPVAGDLGEPGPFHLEAGWKSPRQDHPGPARPRPRASNGSTPCVRAPAGEFKIVARDDNETKWFAFKAPREMGPALLLGRCICWPDG